MAVCDNEYLGFSVKFSKLYSIDEKELTQLWLADKIIQVLDNEPCKKEAINLVIKEFQNDNK